MSTPHPPAAENPRNLAQVLAIIMAVAPDTAEALKPIQDSALYSAPENMGMWWRKAAACLNDRFADHPKRDEIAAIFAGTNIPKGTPMSTPDTAAQDRDKDTMNLGQMVNMLQGVVEHNMTKIEAVTKICNHTRAAVERETAQLRKERDAALKANGELARALDIGPMSESARASLATKLTAAEATVAELQARRAIPDNAVCFFKDGNKWAAVFEDFVNLQESPAGFGDTFDQAFEALAKEPRT